MKLTLGFSPCPNDTFIFDALVNKKNKWSVPAEPYIQGGKGKDKQDADESITLPVDKYEHLIDFSNSQRDSTLF